MNPNLISMHRRMGLWDWQPAPLFPEGDEHQDGAAGDGDGADSGEPDKGFPDNTPVAEMTEAQQVAYWKHQSRKHQARAESRRDYDAIKAKAEKFDQIEAEKLTPSEKAVTEAWEQGKKDALREANAKAATATLTASLRARGKDDQFVSDIADGFNPAAYLTDDDVDFAKIATFVERIAGPVTGGGHRGPGHGQGSRGDSTRATGVSAGADMYAAARKRTAATTS